MTVKIEKFVNDKWCYWATYNLPKDLKMYTAACVSLGQICKPNQVRVTEVE